MGKSLTVSGRCWLIWLQDRWLLRLSRAPRSFKLSSPKDDEARANECSANPLKRPFSSTKHWISARKFFGPKRKSFFSYPPTAALEFNRRKYHQRCKFIFSHSSDKATQNTGIWFTRRRWRREKYRSKKQKLDKCNRINNETGKSGPVGGAIRSFCRKFLLFSRRDEENSNKTHTTIGFGKCFVSPSLPLLPAAQPQILFTLNMNEIEAKTFPRQSMGRSFGY